jgi:DNA-binding CsgD family transcriptional regulator
MMQLVLLGAQLRERGVGLKVIEQGIDTATTEGRAMFGMLPVLAQLQRELIVANTHDGLAAARAPRSRRRPPPPPHRARQAEVAQQLYDAGHHTVQQIADMSGVPRSTVYGHLNKTSIGTRPVTPAPGRAARATRRPIDQRPAPSVEQYDQLLNHPPKPWISCGALLGWKLWAARVPADVRGGWPRAPRTSDPRHPRP